MHPSSPKRPAKAVRPQQMQAAGPNLLTCKISRECGSCAFINSEYQESLNQKYNKGKNLIASAASLTKSTVFLTAKPAPHKLGYRCYAKLALQVKQDAFKPSSQEDIKIGLYQPQTHQVIDISPCPVQTQVINDFVRDLKTVLFEAGISIYDEKTHKGELRYLAVRSAHLTGELMVTFVVTNPELKPKLRVLLNRLKDQDHKIYSAHININQKETNVIFGDEYIKISGADRLRERICDLDVEIGPGVFFQINPSQAELLYHRLEQLIGEIEPIAVATEQITPQNNRNSSPKIAWDFYCGAGIITLLIARRGYRVLGIEENPQAIACAKINAEKNNLKDRLEFMTGQVEELYTEIPTWARMPDLLTVNPSRKGLAPAFKDFLKKHFKQRKNVKLIYVSCDVTTFARDIVDLKEAGFNLRQVEAFDMFPQTDKLEWLGVFIKSI